MYHFLFLFSLLNITCCVIFLLRHVHCDGFCSNAGITTQGRLVITEVDGQKTKCKKWQKASQLVTENDDRELLELCFNRFRTLLIFREFLGCLTHVMLPVAL